MEKTAINKKQRLNDRRKEAVRLYSRSMRMAHKYSDIIQRIDRQLAKMI